MAAAAAGTMLAIAQAERSSAAPPATGISIDASLYPHESRTRITRDLSGLWRFRLDPDGVGEKEGWARGLTDDRAIPVPCSWNDLYDDARDHFGAAWYQTGFRANPTGRDRRVILRFGLVVYHAKVWLNGHPLGEHDGGHLPFCLDATHALSADEENVLVVMVENRLSVERVPAIPDPAFALHTAQLPQTTYDFFPYGGIHRPVLLCEVPRTRVEALAISTELRGTFARVSVHLDVTERWTGTASVLLDAGAGKIVGRADVVIRQGVGHAVLHVPDARLWSPDDPFLHRLTVELSGTGGDEYRMRTGLRTIAVSNGGLLLNGASVTLRGFGKHEDSALHGRGLDLAVVVRDFELLRWIGANSFRTSHYPYAEEILMLADEKGFLVISETPAVSMVFGDPAAVVDARTRKLERDLDALIARDRNHPSVIMWSIANEPLTRPFQSASPAPVGAVATGTRTFRSLFDRVRTLDPTRPATIVSVQGGADEWRDLGDVVCVNSYSGWYGTSGRLADAERAVEKEVTRLIARHPGKPIVYTEFGADAPAGMHSVPSDMWTEEYQADMIGMYLRVLGRHPEVIGVHPWAFADFRTSQSTFRVGGFNHKGVFTRDRRPKLAAHRLRDAWKT